MGCFVKISHNIFFLTTMITLLTFCRHSCAMEGGIADKSDFYHAGKKHFKHGEYTEAVAELLKLKDGELDACKKSKTHYWLASLIRE